MVTPIIHSIVIAVTTTACTFLICLPIVYGLIRHPIKLNWLIESLFLLPLVLPPTVVGLFLLKTFGKYGPVGRLLALFGEHSVIFTLTGAVIATIIVVLPIMYQSVKAAILSVDPSLSEAAKVMGATPNEILRWVILPNAYSGIVAGLLLTFCRGLGEFGASLMVAGYIQGKTDTIATTIYFAIQGGDDHTAVILSVLDVLIGITALLFIQFLNYHGKEVRR